VLFCGINPGLYSGAVGHHFARPGNRFWPVLHQAGFTNRQLAPHEESQLLDCGYGITNIVNKATARADELSKEELRKGAQQLKKKVEKFKPAYLAILGIGAFKNAFQRPRANWGLQKEGLGKSKVWILPNPSG